MRLFLILLLASSSYAAGPKYRHEPSKLDDEIRNIYHDIRQAGGASADLTSSTNTWTGANVFTGSTSIRGTTTNDAAPAGYVGEVASNYAQNVATTGTAYIDVTSVQLTAGDWMITGEYYVAAGAGASVGFAQISITTTSGNSGTGATPGLNTFYHSVNTGASSDKSLVVVPMRVSIASTTTYYLKAYVETGGASVNVTGRLTAWRIR